MTAKTKAKLDTRPIVAGITTAPDKRRTRLSGKTFLFTAAQNNTLLHEGFWNSLLQCAEDKDAVLCVSRFSYNKSGFQTSEKFYDGLWYDERIVPYITDESVELLPDLIFCGELNILPTAATPLASLRNYTRGASGIVPHAKVAMESVPTMKHEHAKFMYTTGAVTLRNYIQKKAGQVADFHHVFGALLVEIDDDGNWWARHLIADSAGVFQDLTDVYTPSGVLRDCRVEAVTHGDMHLEKRDQAAIRATFATDGIMDMLKPKYQFFHDLIDFSARNHHNIRDPHFMHAQRHSGAEDVEKEVSDAAGFLEWAAHSAEHTVVIESNHDRAITQWLKDPAGQFDPANSLTWHRWNARLIAGYVLCPRYSLFADLLGIDEYSVQATTISFVREDESFVICGDSGIECGMHGHIGPNGARGSPKNLRSIGRRANTGHTHSAGIIDGVYTAGVLGALDMGYNKGPSSWSHSSIVTYPSGKRAIITLRNGKWRR